MEKRIELKGEDRSIFIGFIDNVRLRRKENVKLEIKARYLAEALDMNPNVSNASLANAFASRAEAKMIIV